MKRTRSQQDYSIHKKPKVQIDDLIDTISELRCSWCKIGGHHCDCGEYDEIELVQQAILGNEALDAKAGRYLRYVSHVDDWMDLTEIRHRIHSWLFKYRSHKQTEEELRLDGMWIDRALLEGLGRNVEK